MASAEGNTELRPLKAIRRFDVFAEVNRLEALRDGRPEDEAKGHGIWLAKVVAGRRFGRRAEGGERPRMRQEGEEAPGDRPEGKFKHAGDELQTDETFDREIVERMGGEFYDRVFAPAIRAAVERGERYEQIRDSIRAGWKPARARR
jgi:hypothetical protein